MSPRPTTAMMLRPVRDLLAKRQGEITKALPAIGIDAARLNRIALTTIAKGDRRLIEACAASPVSVLEAVMESAQLGLTLDGPLGQAYLVPRKRKGALRVSLALGYKGLVVLACRSGIVSDVAASVVWEGDVWEYQLGSARFLRHIPNDKGPKGDVRGAYAVAYLRGGGGNPPFVFVPTHEIKRRQKLSESGSGKGSPWLARWEAMYRKTAIRELCNGAHFPLSAELAKGVVTDAENEIVLPAVARVDTSPPPDEDGVIDAPQLDSAVEAEVAGDEPPEPPPPTDEDAGNYGSIPF